MNRFRLVAAAAVALAVAGGAGTAAAAISSSPEPSGTASPYVVGGHAPSQAYPAMASLQLDWRGDPNWHSCGATLVSRRYVVTNAHCVTNPDGTGKDPHLYHLRIGSADRTSGGVVAGVTAVLPHADWAWGARPGPVADIALLRLDTYVQLQQIEVAPHLAPWPGSTTRLLGWGVTEPAGEGPLPTGLQEIDTRVVAPAQCAAAGITAGEICVGNPHGTDGACYGDSGGPALQRVDSRRWSLVGGASRETTRACGTGPVVYTDITFYRNWMFEVMRTGTVPPGTPAVAGAGPLVGARTARWAGSAS